MSKPTLGPYRVERRTDKRYGCKIVAPEIATHSAPLPAIATIHTPRSWAEADATADLLAAAPEFRDATAYFVMMTAVDGMYWPEDIVDWARNLMEGEKRVGGAIVQSAVAKAEGRKP